MRILVDTCIWSQVLRRTNPDQELEAKLKDLIQDGRVCMIGPIRQELLSGITSRKQFDALRKNLAAFEDIPLATEHYEKAAEFNNTCRGKGIQGSTIDFLICAVAYLSKLVIYTTDKDFERYSTCLPIKLMR